MAPAPIGRFAPSPSGPLHAGSLLAALGSYLQARHRGGRWLLRIEDIDPPREPAGAAEAILGCLWRHGFRHDGDVEFQSRHTPRYEAALATLRAHGRLYACDCTRSRLRAHPGSAYPGTCRTRELPESDAALRLRLDDAACRSVHYDDDRYGSRREDVVTTVGDFALRRRDGLYAYQLAVVVDDGASRVSEVVRGEDLLDNTARQICLQRALGLPTPHYLHLPVLRGPDGRKLSKQNQAPAVDDLQPLTNLNQAWQKLGQRALPPVDGVEAWMAQAIAAWRPERLPPPTLAAN